MPGQSCTHTLSSMSSLLRSCIQLGSAVLHQQARCMHSWAPPTNPARRLLAEGGCPISSWVPHAAASSSFSSQCRSSALPALAHQLTQTRHMQQSSLYSVKTGRPKPAPWPALERLQGEQLKWKQTVIRPPATVQVAQHENSLLLSGPAGTVKVDLMQLDPTGLVAYKLLPVPNPSGSPTTSIIIASPHAERFQAVVDALESNVQGVLQGYAVALTVKGVGYRLEPVDNPAPVQLLNPSRPYYFEQTNDEKATSITYPYNKPVSAVRLRVGYSRPVIFPLPADVRGFCLKPTLLYLYGLQKDKLQQLAQAIRAVRKPNVYTGNGIQLVGEVLKTKQRSSRKTK